jgi:ABC-type Fe2+-enterobactin transport system substrate-binding protein
MKSLHRASGQERIRKRALSLCPLRLLLIAEKCLSASMQNRALARGGCREWKRDLNDFMGRKLLDNRQRETRASESTYTPRTLLAYNCGAIASLPTLAADPKNDDMAFLFEYIRFALDRWFVLLWRRHPIHFACGFSTLI